MTELPATNHSDSVATGLDGFLIVGLAHSGKTEVRRMIETSSRVRATRRARHWNHLEEKSRDPFGAADVDEWASLLRDDEMLSSLDLDPSDVLANWRSPDRPTFGAILALMHHEDATRHGAALWCAQVNGMEALIGRILTELPAIKVIHTVRDPRDGLGVSRRSGLVGRRGWDLAAWEMSAKVAIASRDRHPGRYMIVRWEDLAASPESVCESLGGFVGTELRVPDHWQLASKPIGKGVGGRRTHREIAPLVEALGYESVAPGLESTVSDVIDLVWYRVRAHRLRRRAGGSSA